MLYTVQYTVLCSILCTAQCRIRFFIESVVYAHMKHSVNFVPNGNSGLRNRTPV